MSRAHRTGNSPPTTIRDVARSARVSTATVSRVLAGLSVVSKPLSKRVHAAARTLNYQPNRIARSLRARTTRIAGVLIPNIQNPFFPGVIRGIQDVLQAADYTVLLGNSDYDPARERKYLDLLRAEGVGGLVLVPDAASKKAYREFLALGLPMVTVDQCVPDLAVDSVTVTNAEGAALVVRHLLAVGHRRIAIVTGPKDAFTATERLAGYRAALTEARQPRDPSLIAHVPFRPEGGYEAAGRLLSLPAPPSAIFATGDGLALGVLRAVHERGLHIPRDVAVVSFDDLPWAAALQPPLTTISQPTYELGATAARLLLERIRDPARPVQRVRLQTRLEVRLSCGAQGRGAMKTNTAARVDD